MDHQVLHMVLLFSAAERLPTCRPKSFRLAEWPYLDMVVMLNSIPG